MLLGYLRTQRIGDPEDVLGEVFLQIVRDLRTFDGGEAAFRSWIFTIAHHRLIDARRKQQRRPSDPTPTEELDAQLERVGPDRDQTEELALATLTTEEVVALLDHLTEEQREVLALRLLAGLTHNEVADLLGIGRGAVRQRWRRALSALQEHLPDDAYPLGGS